MLRQVHALSRNAFNTCLADFPAIERRIRLIAEDRMRKMANVSEKERPSWHRPSPFNYMLKYGMRHARRRPLCPVLIDAPHVFCCRWFLDSSS